MADPVLHVAERERAARGRAGRALAEARYGEDAFADGLAALYRGALARREEAA